MTNFESDIKQVAAPQKRIFDRLSDLQFLEGLKERLPEKARGFSVVDGCLSIKTPMGDVSFKVVETEPNKMIKYESVDSPVKFNLWIQVLPTSASESKMKITAGLDINAFMAGMVKGQVKGALDKMGDALAMLPY